MKRALGSLGLAMKSGRVRCGEETCVKLVRAGAASLVLIDAAISDGSRKAVADACAFHQVPCRQIPSGELGRAIGKPGRMVAAITDKALAQRLDALLLDADTTID